MDSKCTMGNVSWSNRLHVRPIYLKGLGVKFVRQLAQGEYRLIPSKFCYLSLP
jgi:hypothetical protein